MRATPPAPRSSVRWSPRSAAVPTRPSCEQTLALDLIVERWALRRRGVLRAGQTRAHSGDAGRRAGEWRRGATLAAHVESARARRRTAWRWRGARARRWPISSSCSSIPPCWCRRMAGGEPFLISEAVRGEGAWLRNAAGERFMPRYSPDAELAPRDVVARAILSEMLAEGAPSAFLDLRHLPARRGLRALPDALPRPAARDGLDLAPDLIPVAPAAHYFMGGVVVDTWGAHDGSQSLRGRRGLLHRRARREPARQQLAAGGAGLWSARRAPDRGVDRSLADWPTTPALPGAMRSPSRDIVTPKAVMTAPGRGGYRAAIQRVMWERVSLRRDAEGLASARPRRCARWRRRGRLIRRRRTCCWWRN